MMPYEPLDGQLFALQLRLLRAARAMLDPMLNLGLHRAANARTEVLTDEVVLSPAYGAAGNRPLHVPRARPGDSYFYGYTQLMELRAETEIALGKKFDRQAFNDFVIGQGLLPPDLLRQGGARAVRAGAARAQVAVTLPRATLRGGHRRWRVESARPAKLAAPPGSGPKRPPWLRPLW